MRKAKRHQCRRPSFAHFIIGCVIVFAFPNAFPNGEIKRRRTVWRDDERETQCAFFGVPSRFRVAEHFDEAVVRTDDFVVRKPIVRREFEPCIQLRIIDFVDVRSSEDEAVLLGGADEQREVMGDFRRPVVFHCKSRICRWFAHDRGTGRKRDVQIAFMPCLAVGGQAVFRDVQFGLFEIKRFVILTNQPSRMGADMTVAERPIVEMMDISIKDLAFTEKHEKPFGERALQIAASRLGLPPSFRLRIIVVQRFCQNGFQFRIWLVSRKTHLANPL